MSAQFQPTEHLASEAIAAYVDGELRMNPYLRAAAHLAVCAECAAEVDAQQQARGALRDSGEIAVPGSLLGTLAQIPEANLPPQPGVSGLVNRRRALPIPPRFSAPWPWNTGWRRK